MKRSSSVRVVALMEGLSEPRRADPRWKLAQSVVAGPLLSRSPLLSGFLLYVVKEVIEGRGSEITEHKIGVAVFGRPVTYRTDDDNIVRNYARQLRKRLYEHFAEPGCNQSMRIEIPVGGYVPVFSEAGPSLMREPFADPLPNRESPINTTPTAAEPVSSGAFALWPVLLLCAVAVALSALWLMHRQRVAAAAAENVEHDFWQAVLPRTSNTYVVPPDAGFNLLEDMAQQTIPLASYVRGSYAQVPLANVDEHTQQDLHGQQYTDFVSMQMVAVLARQPEYDPRRVLLRFPRDLRLDDLKHANGLIIGSVNANPWAALSEVNTNFRIVPRDRMQSASIVNSHPGAGEQRIYQGHWNEPVHETYGLIQLLPNLSGSGYLLFVQGLDVAGTQAAAECLFHPGSIRPVLKRARLPDGSFRPFEILLRTTSLQSNAEGTTVLASRVD